MGLKNGKTSLLLGLMLCGCGVMAGPKTPIVKMEICCRTVGDDPTITDDIGKQDLAEWSRLVDDRPRRPAEEDTDQVHHIKIQRADGTKETIGFGPLQARWYLGYELGKKLEEKGYATYSPKGGGNRDDRLDLPPGER